MEAIVHERRGPGQWEQSFRRTAHPPWRAGSARAL